MVLAQKLFLLASASAAHVEAVAKLGSHIATIPETIFDKMVQHPLTKSGIDQFMNDWASFKK